MKKRGDAVLIGHSVYHRTKAKLRLLVIYSNYLLSKSHIDQYAYFEYLILNLCSHYKAFNKLFFAVFQCSLIQIQTMFSEDFFCFVSGKQNQNVSK